ncbi:dipeptide/oligopeptide/nickel ABC transporter permease/ATP-binding protein [Arthrobacter sp. GMC3]|uniref:dipeptide/oligopeptide/nickel ABC transporter permease/ATP-binding protein n=1 Tax=Arthrobacter sp. GMC3 TaxID=2058894 RepID=UPI002158784C|nr:dipeptide/oligopeptide/nickel ABC transporter permease/ATP-binding protein [Arthrobacter sp. GMC3]
MRNALSDRRAQAGLLIALFFTAIAIFGPLINEHVLHQNPLAIDLEAFGQPPSSAHLLGTTSSGQDVLAQLIAGASQSMIAGLVAALLGTAIAIIIGVTAGTLGGRIDSALTAVTNIFLTLPGFALILIVAGYTSNAGPVLIGTIIAVFGWAGGSRALRAQSLSLRNRDFVQASRMIGESRIRVVIVEVLPHLTGWVTVMLLMGFVGGILSEAGLAFLGLSGVDTVSWGTMISQAQAQNALLGGMWWWFAPPGLCIVALGGSVALINFALDQSYNPRLSGLSRGQLNAFQKIKKRVQRTPKSPQSSENVLEISGLTVEYVTDRGNVVACKQVSLNVRRGEIVGLAGESGSGKSTLLTSLVRLDRPPAVTTSGSVLFTDRQGKTTDLVSQSEAELRPLRWTSISLVLQSAMTALNPVMRLGDQFIDVLQTHDTTLSKAAAQKKTHELLKNVGIAPNRSNSYPHEMSGGMRQRATIALALACDPELVVMDEPTTAVDVVMQRQILANVLDLQRKFGFAIVFVTHDLSLLVEIADRIAIMYAGKIIEVAAAEEIWNAPQHPYTVGLRDSFPPLSQTTVSLRGIPGAPPDLRNPPSGCSFHPRCPLKFDGCDRDEPELLQIGETSVACHQYEGANPKEMVIQ